MSTIRDVEREMRDSPLMRRPFSSRARRTTFASVAGRILPRMARTSPEVSIALSQERLQAASAVRIRLPAECPARPLRPG